MSELTIALAGNPNTGKSTLFNGLTGSRQQVGNWPGVTVERKEGSFSLDGKKVRVVDLPGIYSLGASSVDEQIASDFLLGENAGRTVVVTDASNLERSLYLVVQLLEMGQSLVVALNMSDVAEQQGFGIDHEKLAELFGVPVISMVAKEGQGIEELKKLLVSRDFSRQRPAKVLESYGPVLGESLGRIAAALPEKLPGVSASMGRDRLALRAAEGDSVVLEALGNADGGAKALGILEDENERAEASFGFDLQTAVIQKRWETISRVVEQVLRREKVEKGALSLSDRVDAFVTNRWIGLPLFLAVAWFMFRVTYLLGDPAADYLDGLVGSLGEKVVSLVGAAGLPDWFGSLLGEGVIGGVGSVVVFFPHIFLLFFMIAVLEDSGYMARGVFVMDRLMRAMGLHGKSFIPMIIGFGCNVPAMMATRILERPRDRMISLLVLPFMSCSARLPVFVLFSGVFFPARAGTVVFSLYLLGIAVAVIAAKVLGQTLFRGEPSQLVMELPSYHLPSPGLALKSAWERGVLFLKKAGTVIFTAVLVIWALASFPLGVEYGSQESIIGQIGTFLAPLFAPAGFGSWQAAVALIFGFLAKEVVVGTLGTLAGTGEAGLAGFLPTLFSPLTAYAFMVMTLLYVPCIAVVGTFKKETNSWKWTVFMLFFTTAIAYVLAVLVFQVGLLMGL